MNVTDLLQKVDRKLEVIRELEERFSDVLAPRFCIFNYLRDDEYGLSRCLGDLLDPEGPHGQGAIFLDRFLTMIDMSQLRDYSAEAEVRLEQSTDEKRRIDIFIKLPNGLIGIENKPWAADQDSQLLDYARFLEQKAASLSGLREWKLIYLSNREPGADSTGGEEFKKYENGHYEHCTYKKLERWLQECAARCNALSVRIFIEELAKYVRINLNGELGMTAEKEVRESVLANAKSIRSAAAIHSAWPAIRSELMEQLIKQMDDKAKELGDPLPIRIDWDDGLVQGKAYHGFNIIFQNDQVNKLRFEFDATRYNWFFWGIAGRGQDSDTERSEKIGSIMEAAFGASKDNRWWHWYAYAGDTEDLSGSFLHWENNPEPWIAIQQCELEGHLFKIIEKVREAFKERMDLLKGPNT